MTLKEKFFFGAAVVVVAIVAFFFVLSLTKGNGSTPTLGAVGNMQAENYIPYVRVNSGYSSAFPIVTTSTFSAAASSFSGLITATAGMLFSSTGTQVNRINFGTCYVQASATTIAASTTVAVDCQASTTGANTALTGVTAGDIVFAQFATTTSAVYHGLNIHGVSASSTPGFITISLFNGTGATYTWTAAASTTNYIVIH